MRQSIIALSVISALTFSYSGTSNADSSEPVAANFKLENANVLQIPELSQSAIQNSMEKYGKLEKVYPFAISYQERESYTNMGAWQDLGDKSVWRLKVDAKNTHSLNFGFKNLFLPAGAQVFIYNQDMSEVLGPYTDQNNNQFKELWTPVLQGGVAIIEISVPKQLKEYLTFDLATINQGYRGVDANTVAKSGSCNIDVICPVADPWRKEIRSVAKYTFTKNGSSFLCTGTLVNNTAQDSKPYFLTANHCLSDQATASSMVFYWNYEATACDGARTGSQAQRQNGATLRSTWSTSDMTLVELNAAPSASFNVHWAGWDNTAAAPTKSVAIHHPRGHEKRISFDNDAPTFTSYGSSQVVSNSSHLRIGAWDQGTTEGGSSGSAIWNTNHHVVGTLHGGTASCSAPNDPDYYGRVHRQWLGGGTASSQLKAWLDPNDTGATTLDGKDACSTPTVTISSITPNPAMIGDVVSFVGSASGGSGSGYTYEWDFNGDGTVDSRDANPSHTYSARYSGNVTLSVSDLNSCSASTSAAIVVNGPNRAPEAKVANSSITVNEGANVSLDASSSSDPDGDTLKFEWKQISGSTVSLSNANAARASFTAPQVSSATDLSFEVTVTDPDGLSAKAKVDVKVNDVPTPPPTNGGGGGGGSATWLLLAVLGLFSGKRVLRNSKKES